MRSFRRNKQGQLVIIATLIIVVFTLALVFSISQVSLSMQELKYEPFQETALTIASDFDRCITYALSLATHEYNETGSLEESDQVGNEFITKWVNALLASYSNLGLNVTIAASESGATDIVWWMDWNSSFGVSYVYADFRLDINAYGFKGWMSKSLRAVYLNLISELIDTNMSSVTVEFQIIERKSEGFNPVSNLTIEDLYLTLDTILTNVPVNITSLTYQGSGIYIIHGTYASGDGIQQMEILGVTLSVITPNDNIVVSASTSGDEWRNLYIGEGGSISTCPPEILHGNMFINPTLSQGQSERIASSESIPQDIGLDETIKGTLWLELSSRQKSVQLNITLGFTYNGSDYIIGYDVVSVTSVVLQPYYLAFNATQGNYPEGYYLSIPEGSEIFIEITLVESDHPGVSSIKIFFGYNPDTGEFYLSGIKLY